MHRSLRAASDSPSSSIQGLIKSTDVITVRLEVESFSRVLDVSVHGSGMSVEYVLRCDLDPLEDL